MTTIPKRHCYEATGAVANARLAPLLPNDWIDVSTGNNNKRQPASANNDNDDDNDGDTIIIHVPDFLWENCPRQATKSYRDDVKVYSHLPNGSAILDSKWVLGRLLTSKKIVAAPAASSSSRSISCGDNDTCNPLLAVCETHCFTGMDGFREFALKMNLLQQSSNDKMNGTTTTKMTQGGVEDDYTFPDLCQINNGESDGSSSLTPYAKNIPPRPNLWVVKDAMANGAGGVWVVGPENAHDFLADSTQTPLYPEHKYVAQEYVWPLITYSGKKCHVRVYATITYDGRAFVHERAFLHVANELFSVTDTNDNGSKKRAFDDCVHITNCCANSHDNDKFAGEILADFTTKESSTRDGQQVVPLADFFPSVQATVVELCQKAFPFMEGGQKNHGFEYCGMDFILSYDEQGRALAYLLEINAPPSQDTATGLPHAENLHNDVLRDWMNYWVVPHVEGRESGDDGHLGGWKCVHKPKRHDNEHSVAAPQDNDLILPSKAAILNKIRWALLEKKALKAVATRESLTGEDAYGTQQPGVHEVHGDAIVTRLDAMPITSQISKFARSQFPYFSSQRAPIFFENAGGAQVPQSVVDGMMSSLQCRNRSIIGTETKARARATIKTLFGAENCGSVVLGQNATCLIARLASVIVDQRLFTSADDIIISTENHKAHFDPWVTAAKKVGATIKFWSPSKSEEPSTTKIEEWWPSLEELVSPRTRIVAMSHANNVLGLLRPIKQLSRMIKSKSDGRAMVMVDGVAAVPHVFAAFDDLGVDFYAVSMHKMFGPHVGALIARRGEALDDFTLDRHGVSSGIIDQDDCFRELMEQGTLNIEGCAGVVGVGEYLKALASRSGCLGDEQSNIACHAGGAGETAQEKGTLPFPQTPLSTRVVESAYGKIQQIEAKLARLLVDELSQMHHVRLLQPILGTETKLVRLPIVSFVHDDIPSSKVVKWCAKNGIVCRYGLFLNTDHFATEFDVNQTNGMVRISLAHYNTEEEIRYSCQVLRRFPGW
jgi:selenocysteine lyase/cysteine desulfurase